MDKFKIFKKIIVYSLLPGVLWGAFFSSAYADTKLPADPLMHVADMQAQVVNPNDPFFTTDDNDSDAQWYLDKMDLPHAWDITKGSTSVVVAVVDTGIHASHLDLDDGRIINGYNVLTEKTLPAGADSDDNGHGTAVAGVIGAIADNNKGISGINWNISIMPVKALDASGTGTVTNVSKGIMWAADHGANIINLSLGASGFSQSKTLSDAITYAFNRGIVIVAAAGNDKATQGLNLDETPVYPICSDNGQNMVIGVAASDINDRKADFSNFGINCVDITAPGKRIITTGFLPDQPSNNILIYGSGTSLAAPMVSGVAALMKAAHPEYSNMQVRDTLLRTADNIDDENQNNCLNSSCNGFLGKGRLNAYRSVLPNPVQNGQLVRQSSTGKVFYIENGIKRLVSNFVYDLSFKNQQILDETNQQLKSLPMGDPVLPTRGLLIKSKKEATVYFIDNSVIRPISLTVFNLWHFKFSDVLTVSDSDLDSLKIGEWYWPPDGTTMRIGSDPTVYVMDSSVARPVTYFVFKQRGLSFAKVLTISDDEFSHLPRPEDKFWLAPLDGTLIKAAGVATVYVIENSTRRALSGTAFAQRGYKFANVNILPVSEVQVIAQGSDIL